MGQFSWMYANTNNEEQMLDNVRADSYLLVPPPFQDTYGKYIKEECYDGYGRFGRYDVYELIAEWNREHLSHHMLRDCKAKSWRKEDIEAYLYGLKRQIHRVERLIDYENEELNDIEMTEKYGFDWKRLIGIDIACYNEQNESLPYPIKITNEPLEYDDVIPSKDDPNQGWLMEDFEEDEW